jgi:hypothetical protein
LEVDLKSNNNNNTRRNKIWKLLKQMDSH